MASSRLDLFRTLRGAADAPPLLESRNARMRQVLAMARRAAESDAMILVSGESGVGKNVIAAAIHRWSPRAAEPYVTIACTTLGAVGRLEAAERGTAFLDEIGELPAEPQAELLRFLEERSFDVETRIVAATSRRLGEEVRAGRFREDLFYRLNVVALELPPLRERREDIRALTDHVLTTLAFRRGCPNLKLAPPARRAIDRYPWPGNVRELINALERAVVLGRGNVIDAENLPDRILAPTATHPAPSLAGVPDSLEDLERVHVQRTIAESATLEEAALRLGINPTTLWRKRKRWGLG